MSDLPFIETVKVTSVTVVSLLAAVSLDDAGTCPSDAFTVAVPELLTKFERTTGCKCRGSNGQSDDIHNLAAHPLRRLGLGVSWLFYLPIMLAGRYILYAAFMIHPW